VNDSAFVRVRQSGAELLDEGPCLRSAHRLDPKRSRTLLSGSRPRVPCVENTTSRHGRARRRSICFDATASAHSETPDSNSRASAPSTRRRRAIFFRRAYRWHRAEGRTQAKSNALYTARGRTSRRASRTYRSPQHPAHGRVWGVPRSADAGIALIHLLPWFIRTPNMSVAPWYRLPDRRGS